MAPRMEELSFVFCAFLCLLTYSQCQGLCQRRFLRRTIRVENCFPKTIFTFGCRGTCATYSRPSTHYPGQIERHCECCKEGSSERKIVNIFCPSGVNNEIELIRFNVRVPITCDCRVCAMLPDEIIGGDDIINGKRSDGNHTILNEKTKTTSSPKSFQFENKTNTPNL